MNPFKLQKIRQFLYLSAFIGACNIDPEEVEIKNKSKIEELVIPAVTSEPDRKEEGKSALGQKKPKYFNYQRPLQEIVDEFAQDRGRKKVIIDKSDRVLGLYLEKELLKEYPLALGRNPFGPKLQRGDLKTPEGSYRALLKYPETPWDKGLLLNYPNGEDAERSLQAGIITVPIANMIKTQIKYGYAPSQRTALGSGILIHGGGNKSERGDWTLGCVAVSKKDMDEIYDFIEVGNKGTEIVINP